MKRRKPEMRPEPQEFREDPQLQCCLLTLEVAMKFADQAMTAHPGNRGEQVTWLISRIKLGQPLTGATTIALLEMATLLLDCDPATDEQVPEMQPSSRSNS